MQNSASRTSFNYAAVNKDQLQWRHNQVAELREQLAMINKQTEVLSISEVTPGQVQTLRAAVQVLRNQSHENIGTSYNPQASVLLVWYR